jgi:hypothetical protein
VSRSTRDSRKIESQTRKNNQKVESRLIAIARLTSWSNE